MEKKLFLLAGMSERCERANRAGRSKRMIERCKQTNKQTSEWPGTLCASIGYSLIDLQWIDAVIENGNEDQNQDRIEDLKLLGLENH